LLQQCVSIASRPQTQECIRRRGGEREIKREKRDMAREREGESEREKERERKTLS